MQRRRGGGGKEAARGGRRRVASLGRRGGGRRGNKQTLKKRQAFGPGRVGSSTWFSPLNSNLVDHDLSRSDHTNMVNTGHVRRLRKTKNIKSNNNFL